MCTDETSESWQRRSRFVLFVVDRVLDRLPVAAPKEIPTPTDSADMI